MKNILSIENDFIPQINKLWESNKDLDYVNRGYAVPRELKRHSILFIGINPSYKENPNKPTIYEEIKYDLYSDKVYPYFKKFKEIQEYCNAEWSHWDLTEVRESSQNKLIDSCNNAKFFDFVQKQLRISREVITQIEPKIIVVCNTKARDFLIDKSCNPYAFNLIFDNEIGTYRIQEDNNLNAVPVFFSGMLTGQRALDLGSYERLKWHINWVLSKI